MEKIPYMLIVGDKRTAGGHRIGAHQGQGDVGTRSLNEFIEEITEMVNSKK